ncbi:MAG: glycosyltransferase family 4 protein [Kiritimatiellae bacterium]|nr:glycosyltransferase family 4 protein [Kiritimatiellia bacterium]
MKILQVLPALEQGGVERGTLEVAAALAAAGIPNAVASAGGRLEGKLAEIGVEHFRLPLASKNPFIMRRNGTALAKIAKEGGFTLMHVRSRAPAWSVRRASRLSGVPFISTWHGLYGTEPGFLKLPYNRIMLSGLVTIAVSDCVRNHILSVYGADPAKVRRIHRGADIDTFRPDAVAQEEALRFKTSLGFPSATPVMTLPGRLTYWKGQRDLLMAAVEMKHDAGILFVGSDQGRKDYTAELKSLASALPAGRPVVFLEHTDNMPLVYAASDIVVSASSAQPEAFGRVIPEAQAMGKIVVGTAHGGACETIEDGRTGLLVPPANPDALAAALDRVFDMDASARAAMSAAAVKSVADNFSVAKMCAETLELYREVHHGLD